MALASRPRIAGLVFILLGAGSLGTALDLAAQQTTPSSPANPPAATVISVPFDAVAATNAYLATVKREDRVRSDAYFEGGYWLQLWDFLLAVGVNVAILVTGLSRRMRDLAERLVRFRSVQTILYFGQYLIVTTFVLLPMTIYEGFAREHRYGLSNQTFGPWMGDQAKGLLVGLLAGGLAVTALYAVVRRLPRTWAFWGSVVAIASISAMNVIAPVYVAPLFNRYTRMVDGVVRDRILSLARAEGVPSRDVWVFDASRQTKRISANVSGLATTMRISLNDNLINRCSMAEIEATMGHEMGHFVLNHIYKLTLFLGVVVAIGFAFLKWGFERAVAWKGVVWGIRGASDPAGLPLAVTLLSVYFFLLTPVLNTYTRMEEAEADLFGINASGQPDGEALTDLKLGEYRKLDPSPLEEAFFFDHPGGRSRIVMAMKWKGEHLAEAEANARWAAELDRQRGWSAESAKAWAREHEPHRGM
jgi:STE24 endopeptidase